MNWCLAVCVPMRTLRFSSPSGSKCHHLQCLLLRAKANALRLNELSLTDFMHIMALTPTRLRKIESTQAHIQPDITTHMLNSKNKLAATLKAAANILNLTTIARSTIILLFSLREYLSAQACVQSFLTQAYPHTVSPLI